MIRVHIPATRFTDEPPEPAHEHPCTHCGSYGVCTCGEPTEPEDLEDR